jgi:hypothetical protein
MRSVDSYANNPCVGLAVIAERLAVIAGNDHQRRPRAAAHGREQWTERGVDRRHFAEIRSIPILAIVRRGRPIRRVRLVDMDPGEPASGGLRVDPRRRQRDDR